MTSRPRSATADRVHVPERSVPGADPAIEEKPGALVLRSRVEGDVELRIASVTRADHGRLNRLRAAGALAAVADVDGMKPLDEGAALFRAHHEEHRLRGGIDDRRRGDADVAGEVDVGAARLTDVGA